MRFGSIIYTYGERGETYGLSTLTTPVHSGWAGHSKASRLPSGVDLAHPVSEHLGLLQGAKIIDEVGATRVWPGDADLKAQRPRRSDIVGEHPANVARLCLRCTPPNHRGHPGHGNGQGGQPGIVRQTADQCWLSCARYVPARTTPQLLSW